MNVLAAILNWSKDRPAWQRDALRRLVLKGELDNDDIGALTKIAKNAHGLAEEQEVIPLGKQHLPTNGKETGRVDLRSIYHNRGVNALAQDQILELGPGLTVVYGDNAAGKSGYTRILKSACRARGSEDILGNVLSGEAPLSPIVSIKYTVSDGDPQEWTGEGEDEFIGRVSVFDSHCASVYLTQQTDVAFRPFGLDLFDKLSKACQAVRVQLESEKHALGGSTVRGLALPEGTQAAKFLAQLSSLSKPGDLKILVMLSENEQGRLTLLEKQLLDLQANDPAKTAHELALRAGPDPCFCEAPQGTRHRAVRRRRYEGLSGAGRRQGQGCRGGKPSECYLSRRPVCRHRLKPLGAVVGSGPPFLRRERLPRPRFPVYW